MIFVVLSPLSAQGAEGVCGAVLAHEETKVLNDRLRVRLPGGATNEARQRNVMAAPESNDEESRFVINRGKERMVVMAYELFARAPAGFKSEVERIAGAWGKDGGEKLSVVAVVGGRGLSGYQIVSGSGKLSAGKEAVLVGMAYVVDDTDRSIQLLRIYVNPEAAKKLPACQQMAASILSSLRPGERKLLSQGGSRSAAIPFAKEKLRLELPEGFVASVTDGGDYFVHLFRELVDYGKSGRRLGVFVGRHPGYHYRSARIPETEIYGADGVLFGKKVRWVHWVRKDDAGKVVEHTMELIQPLPLAGDSLTAHIFFSAPTFEEMAGLKKAAASLALVGP